jgi:hypothetical protein
MLVLIPKDTKGRSLYSPLRYLWSNSSSSLATS